MNVEATIERPFELPNRYRDPVRRALFGPTKWAMEKALAFDTLNAIYAEIQDWDDPRHFADKALSALGVVIDVDEEAFAQMPTVAPLVVVANHPFGGLEGLILVSLLRRVRPDSKVLANYFLRQIPDLRDSFFFVDPFGGPEAASRNVGSMREAIRFVRAGGALGVFPAGEVAHFDVRQRRVIDPPWSDTVARLIRRTEATVLPVCFGGRNSDLFQVLGLVHPRMRTVMLPRELLKKRDSRVHVHVGRPIPYDRLNGFKDVSQMTAYLRVRTSILKSRARGEHAEPVRRFAEGEPIIDPVAAEELAQEVAALPASQFLSSNNSIQVYYGSAEQLPAVLREIGRLRELTFRAVGEGTGQAVDLDEYDQTYLHLFAWDEAAAKIVGAYRMGQTDVILPRQGNAGLYTSTLFHYKTGLLEQISPALELGRSFVHPDYQKQYTSLMLLWRGIGKFVCKFPRYRMLFGPVSISSDYESISKQLLMVFLKLNSYLPDLARLIRPRNPPRYRPLDDWDPKQTSTTLRDIDDVDELIRDIEADRKSIPVLLRQYLKLNGRLLGFNVDPDFGDVLDGLLLADLLKVDRKVLLRYMGREQCLKFLAHHGVEA